MKKLAVLAMIGLMSVTASAANWVSLGSASDGTTIYIDADSISNSSGYKTAFIRYDLNRYDEIIAFKSYNSITSLVKFDCKANPRKSRSLSNIFRNGDRVVLVSNTKLDWAFIHPDTTADSIAKFVCSSKK